MIRAAHTTVYFSETIFIMTLTPAKPETVTIDDCTLGSHVEHWQCLGLASSEALTKHLQASVEASVQPFGLHQHLESLPQEHWLIYGPDQQPMQLAQLIKIDAEKGPIGLLNAFPVIESPYHYVVTIERIVQCPKTCEAVLALNLNDGATVYAFDRLFAINQALYRKQQTYTAVLSGLAYDLETVLSSEHMVIDDPAAIRHHRALNSVLAAHNGQAPDNLQALLEAWQPSQPEDTLPVTLDLSTMCAYLFGEELGQEDEAWIQGEILGYQHTTALGQPIDLYDVAMLREEAMQPLVIRLAHLAQPSVQPFNVGDYIRGNIWLQAALYPAV